MVKVFVDYILWEFVIHVYSDILYWYIVCGDKAYLRKKTVLLWIWVNYNQFCQMIIKLSDYNML